MAYTFRHGDRPLEGVTIQRAVGRGGFGEVYYALTDSGKQVGLKYLRDNPEIELRGISHVMNLKSPHLITIYDVRRNAEGEPFVIMEYVGGPSLRELMLAEPHGLGAQKAAFFVDGIAKGLAYLHDRGIVHRDLKPANIFYDDGYVKIGDYGLSKHMSVSKHSGQTVSVGTVHYMAPEIGSGSYTKAIDVYALGVILFELLTGRLPFTGSSMGEILMRHLSARPDLSGIPEPFAGVISKALAKDPQQRYQDAGAMADALREFADISASIASFDATTLSNAPRSCEAVDPERTLTTPPRVPPPPPPMDVQARQASESVPDKWARKFQEKADKFARKLEKEAEKLRRKGAKLMGREPQASPESAAAAEGQAASAPSRKAQIFVLLAVGAAVGIALAVLHGGRQTDEKAGALVFCIIAGTFGPLLSYFKFLQRSPARSLVWDKLTYVAVTTVFMIPAFGLASEVGTFDDRFAPLLVAPLAALVFCNWTKRIEAGRRGQVSGGSAFWPGLVGLIAASIAGAESYQLVAACVCATMSLLTQAGASLWPAPRGIAPPRTPSGGEPAGDAAPWADRPEEAGGAPRDSAVRTRLWWSRAHKVRRGGAPHDGPASGPAGALVPRSAFMRGLFGVLSTLVLAGSLGAFFVLVIADIGDADACSALLFATLGGVAWLPLLLSKALHRYKMPIWRGTLRMLIVSVGLCLTAGMITVISFQDLRADELGGAIFGLVAGAVIALVTLLVPGRRWHGAPPPLSEQPGHRREPAPEPAASQGPAREVAPEGQTQAVARTAPPPAPPPPVLIDASAPSFVGRAANAGLSFAGKLLLLLGLVLALGSEPLREQVQQALTDNDVQVSSRLLSEGLPEPLLLAVTTAGCMLLLLARRGSGPAHVLRGCLSCTLVLGVVVTALGPTADAWHELFSGQSWSKLNWDDITPTLFGTAIALSGAFILLTWPQRRRDRTVVV